MAIKYVYTKTINSDLLRSELITSSLSSNFLFIELNGSDVDVWFSNSLTTEEETTLTNLVNAHIGYKYNKAFQLTIDTRNYINERYATERQQTLSVLLADARTPIYSIDPVVFSGSGLNDATSSGTYLGYYNLPKYKVTIDSVGTPDTFSIEDVAYNEIIASNVPIDGTIQDLDQGVKIQFTATTGHTLNDIFYIKVKRTSRVNRANYIAQALGWVMAVLNYHYSKTAEIMACSTEEQVNAVTWSFAAYTAADPLVAIQTALGITN